MSLDKVSNPQSKMVTWEDYYVLQYRPLVSNYTADLEDFERQLSREAGENGHDIETEKIAHGPGGIVRAVIQPTPQTADGLIAKDSPYPAPEVIPWTVPVIGTRGDDRSRVVWQLDGMWQLTGVTQLFDRSFMEVTLSGVGVGSGFPNLTAFEEELGSDDDLGNGDSGGGGFVGGLTGFGSDLSTVTKLVAVAVIAWGAAQVFGRP